MPTPETSKQITVTISGEILEMFNELIDSLNITKEAELFRMALKTYYKDWKGERSDYSELKQEVANIRKRIEELKK
jgi:metal-responsive CopG/Arc/MetJ family transcriptional regulator